MIFGVSPLENLGCRQTLSVMPGLGPGTHAFSAAANEKGAPEGALFSSRG